jgi:hypothetical protein
LDAGLFDQAVNDFELALFEDPNHRGAQIDLTIALCQVGDVQRCDAGLSRLRTQYPDHPVIKQLQAALTPKRWQHLTHVSLGESDNINQGLAIQQVALTINGLPVALMVAPQSLAKSARYTDVLHHSQWQSTSLPNRWEAQLQGYVRQLDDWQTNQLTYGQAQIKQRHTPLTNCYYWAWGVGLTHLNYQQQYIYTAPKVLLELGWDSLAWQPKLQYQHEVRYFNLGSDATLDTWLMGVKPVDAVQFQLSYTQDSSLERLGGNAQRWQWQVAVHQPIWSSFSLEGMLYGLLSQDQQVYAPPMVDVQRSTAQQGWQLGLQYMANAQWGGQCLWRQQQQSANHPLFEWQESGWQCGVFVAY